MINTIVDINHDNHIDFDQARTAGIVAVIHKATEGADFKDDKYRARRDMALSKGFLWGAYHFSSGRRVSEQVDNFLDNVQWGADSDRDKGTLLCLDFEPSSSGPDMTLEQAEDFVLLIRNKTGRYPMIYGGSLLRERLGTSENQILRHCPLWYARYRNSPVGIPVNTWDNYTLWQYTDGEFGPAPHSVPGMGGTDRNQFAGTKEDLQAAWPFAGTTAPMNNDFEILDVAAVEVGGPGEPDFSGIIEALKLRYFTAAEILNPTYNVNNGVANSRPPRNLWENIFATIVVLDEIRHQAGVPISLNSTYRSKAYNNTLTGAAPHSQHLDFRAIDFHSSGASPEQLETIAKSMRGKKFKLPFSHLNLVAEQAPLIKAGLKIKSAQGTTTFEYHGGIQAYNSFVHIDCRGDDVSWG